MKVAACTPAHSGTTLECSPHATMISWRRELRALSSLAVFLLINAFFFQSWSLAFAITAVLGIHELGHVSTLARFTRDWEIGFSPVGAWTRSSQLERRSLGHFINSTIHLAGPFFNLVYAAAALIFTRALPLISTDTYWLRLANLSALVALINLLPFGHASDGGKFLRRMFSSLDKRHERQVLWVVLGSLLALLWLLLLTRGRYIQLLGIAMIAVWFTLSLLRESRIDDQTAAGQPGSMHHLEAFFLFAILLVLILASTMVITLTPFWLTEADVWRMAGNLYALFVWFLFLPAEVKLLLLLVMAFFVGTLYVLLKISPTGPGKALQESAQLYNTDEQKDENSGEETP